MALIVGQSAQGKSMSLQTLKKPKGVMYLNTESNKKLPFDNCKFQQYTITEPGEVEEAFVYAKDNSDEFHTIVIDTFTFLMEMYETQVINTAKDTREAWGQYAQYIKRIMHNHIPQSPQNILILAHAAPKFNEDEETINVAVPIKGSIGRTGFESFFSCVVAAKVKTLKELEDYENDLLTYNEDEEELGIKHVFQTKLTKRSLNEKLRGPLNMWSKQETYINNDAQALIDRLRKYYK